MLVVELERLNSDPHITSTNDIGTGLFLGFNLNTPFYHEWRYGPNC